MKEKHPSKNNKIVVSILLVLVISLLFWIAFKRIDISVSLKLLKSISILYVLLFLLISFFIQYIKAAVYYLSLKALNLNIPFNKVVKIFLASQLLSFLPGGEVGRIMLTKSEAKTTTEKATSAVIMLAYVELFSAVIVGLLGSLYFKAFIVPALLSLTVLGIFIYILLSEKMWNLLINAILKIKYFIKFKKNIESVNQLLRTQIFSKETLKVRAIFVKIMLLTMFAHFVGGVFIYTISLAFALNLNLLNSTFAFCVSIIIQGILAIIPGGIGFTEGGLVGLLLFFKNSLEKAVALTITFRVTGFLFNVFVGMLVYLVFYRKSLTKQLKKI